MLKKSLFFILVSIYLVFQAQAIAAEQRLDSLASSVESSVVNSAVQSTTESTATKGVEAGIETAIETDSGAHIENQDPWQGFNEAIFSFNDGLDYYFLKPVAKGYRYIAPDFIELGVSNVYFNLFEVSNIFNDVLQWKWPQAGNDSARLLVNSTLGLGGIFDVAAPIGFERSEGEDFGQTLAVWGVESGPYLVLPLLGPSTLRDGAALPVNWATAPVGYIDHVSTRNTVTALGIVSTRANLLTAEAFVSGDRYIFIRDAFLQRRGYLILDGAVEDDFGEAFETEGGADSEYGY